MERLVDLHIKEMILFLDVEETFDNTSFESMDDVWEVFQFHL
jgi:hypothetical protein